MATCECPPQNICNFYWHLPFLGVLVGNCSTSHKPAEWTLEIFDGCGDQVYSSTGTDMCAAIRLDADCEDYCFSLSATNPQMTFATKAPLNLHDGKILQDHTIDESYFGQFVSEDFRLIHCWPGLTLADVQTITTDPTLKLPDLTGPFESMEDLAAAMLEQWCCTLDLDHPNVGESTECGLCLGFTAAASEKEAERCLHALKCMAINA